MGKNYAIYTTTDPGPALIELTAKLIEPLSTIDIVRFERFSDDTEGKTAVFIPEKKEVVIDLGTIINNYDLHRMGMMYIPGIWYTVLWEIFHEVTHGRQYETHPDMFDNENMTDDESAAKVATYEFTAQTATKELVRQYVSENPLPPIKEWGWLGEQITETVNALYVRGDTHLLDELDILNQGAVAHVETVLASYQFDDPSVMYRAIEEGDQGIKLGEDYYLTAIDFFGLDEPIEVVSKSAPTIFMG